MSKKKVVHWYDNEGNAIRYDSISDFAEAEGISYQTAFEEFVIYIHQGHLWAQDSAMVLKERLLKRAKTTENGHSEHYEYREYKEVADAPKSRVQELLLPYIEELETENRNLKAWKAKIMKLLNETK